MVTLKITSRISLNFHQHLSQNLHDILILLGLGRLAAALLGKKDSVDVGEDPALGNGDAGQQLVQLLVITDGEL